MTKIHVMIDLETLGTGPRSVVTQIGWVGFHPFAPEAMSGFVFNVDPEEQMRLGRKCDWETIAWWLKQSEEARRSMIGGGRVPLRGALGALVSAYDWENVGGVWGHGATFDISLMESLFADTGQKAPWHHSIVRDTRTLFWASDLPKDQLFPLNPCKHNAMEDAKAQAVAVQRAIKSLGTQPI